MILLPVWKASLKELKLAAKIMPCDVSTWWNSTYDMLSFAIEYHKALESITANWKNDLQQFELSEDEWVIAEQVCDTLKVCEMVPKYDHADYLSSCRSSRTQHCTSHVPPQTFQQ